MEAIDLKNIPFRERFMLLEKVWDSLREEQESQELSPLWHKEELQSRLNSSNEDFIDIDSAKETLYKGLNGN